MSPRSWQSRTGQPSGENTSVTNSDGVGKSRFIIASTQNSLFLHYLFIYYCVIIIIINIINYSRPPLYIIPFGPSYVCPSDVHSEPWCTQPEGSRLHLLSARFEGENLDTTRI